MTEERKQSLHSISVVISNLYNTLHSVKKEVAFPLHEIHLQNIDSIVKTVNAAYFGLVRYPTNQEKASAYFCYIIKNHPMTDGNKRLATLWLEVFCSINNLKINPNLRLDELAITVETEKTIKMDLLIDIVKILLFDQSVNTVN